MPKSLLSKKIEEALVTTGREKHDAQKLLIAWAIRDPALLLAMTKPHLKAIAAGHVDHFSRQKSGAKDENKGADSLTRESLGDIMSSDDRRRNTVVPPPKSTARQASTMRTLAEAFVKKKK